MTASQRARELRHLLEEPIDEPTSIAAVQRRVSDLVGRGVYTHELLFPDLLVAEIMGEIKRPDRAEILRRAKVAMGGKPVIAVDADTGEVWQA